MSRRKKIIARILESDAFHSLAEAYLNSTMGAFASDDYMDGVKLLWARIESEIYAEEAREKELLEAERLAAEEDEHAVYVGAGA